MKGPSPRGILRFAGTGLRLKRYLKRPGDGRQEPRIPARSLVWSLLIGTILREISFRAIEALVGSRARSGLGVGRRFGDDALSYFTERLNPETTRQALAGSLKQAKRNKAFDSSRFIGFALDGTTT